MVPTVKDTVTSETNLSTAMVDDYSCASDVKSLPDGNSSPCYLDTKVSCDESEEDFKETEVLKHDSVHTVSDGETGRTANGVGSVTVITDTTKSHGVELVNPSDAGGGVSKEKAIVVPKTTIVDLVAKGTSANTPGGTTCRDTTVEGATVVAKEAGS